MKKRTPAKRTIPPSKSRRAATAKTIPGAIPLEANVLGTFHGELSIAERHAAGRALRAKVPREAHGGWSRPADHPGAVEIVLAGNRGRQPDLVPLRMARMCASPFAFYRGAAAVMASDLDKTPISGIHTVIDGDAHLNNFGLYGTPQRDVVFDLNDFDEAIIAPWEWDLKRLIASVNIAARENGFNRRERDAAVRRCVAGYNANMNRLEDMGILDIWYLHAHPGRENPLVQVDAKTKAVFRKAVDKASTQTNLTLLNKVAEKLPNGGWQFRQDPPVLTRVDNKTRQEIIEALHDYAPTLYRERQFMFTKYHVIDVAHRVVGVGSVGTRAYLVLLFGSSENDPLFLQVKQGMPAAHAPYAPPGLEEFAHDGKRIVTGQRALQASIDVMLGWTSIGSTPFYVRQMKNMKGAIPIEWLSGVSFNFYAWACGAILARAHARTADAAAIAGYCGKSNVLADALALWAEAYANQTVLDHAALVNAFKSDREVQAMMGK
jgi:uncharacterized protein (DUF2252 family)